VSRGERFATGVLAGLVGPFGIAVFNLFLLPRIVHGFGDENYGAFLLMLSCAGWVTTMHMGAGVGIVRYAAEGEAVGDPAAARAAAVHGAELQLGFSALTAVVVFLAAPILVGRVFDFPAALATHGVWMLRAAAFGGFFMAVSSWASAVFQGYQSYRRFGLLALAQGVLPNAGIAVVLAQGRGLYAATVWFVAVQALIAAWACVEFLRLTRAGRGRPHGGPGLRVFSRYSISFWPGALANFATGQLVRVFVAGLRTLAEFTLYAVPLGLLQRLQTLPAAVGSALLPVIGGIRHESEAELESVYLRCSRVLAALIAPAYALLFAVIPQFLSLWLGGRFGDEAVWPARVMVVTQAVGLLAFVPNSVAAGRRGGVWVSASQWSQVAICLVLWPTLIPRLGLLGASLGSLAAQIVATAVVLWYAHYRVMGLGARRFTFEALGPSLAGSILLLAAVWPLRERVSGWVSLVAVCALGGVVYAATAWFLLPKADRQFLRQRLPIPRLR